MIITGDCVEVMAGMEPDTFDAIVTDPPYRIEFMGKAWDDADEGHHAWAEQALRVTAPGGFLLAFGGTRTVHRLMVALEDSGWQIKDLLCWAYAQGFPKSRASLKPAWEPIVMCKRPGPTRFLDIDGCRLPVSDEDAALWASAGGYMEAGSPVMRDGVAPVKNSELNTGRRVEDGGRWPANLVLTDPILDGGWETVVGGGSQAGGGVPARRISDNPGVTMGTGWNGHGPYETGMEPVDTSGTYSRFFLVPKASRSDREPIATDLPIRAFGQSNGVRTAIARGELYEPGQRKDRVALNRVKHRRNIHPTVKPIELMRHLVRLVTPKGGHVLDPFLGSGTTGIAAEMEGFAWTGIEREPEYVAIAESRLDLVQRGLGL